MEESSPAPISVADAVPTRRRCAAFGVVTAVALYLICIGLSGVSDFHLKNITGDIPHYLIAVQSFVEDGDFDLANNAENAASYRSYHRTPLQPQVAPGTMRPYRSIGLPLLLAPGWLIGGPHGSLHTAAIFICAAAGLLGVLAYQATGAMAIGLALAALTVFNFPLLGYLFNPYPDLFSGVIHLLFFLLITRRLRESARPVVWAAAASLLLAPLGWMHFKFFAMHPAHVALIGLWAPARRRLACIVLASVLLGVNLVGHLVHQWSVGVDMRLYAGSNQAAPWPEAVFGLLFDRQFGIFYLFPLIALPLMEIGRQVIAGPRRMALTALTLIVSLYAMHAWSAMWWAGWSPPGRYTLNFLFIVLWFFIPFVQRCRERPRFAFDLACGLLAVISLLHLVIICDPERLWRAMGHHPVGLTPPFPENLQYMERWGVSGLLEIYPFHDALPSLVFITGKGLRTLFLTMTALVLATVWHAWPDMRAAGRPRVRSLVIFGLLWAAGCGLLYWDLHAHHRRTKDEAFREVFGRSPADFRREAVTPPPISSSSRQ